MSVVLVQKAAAGSLGTTSCTAAAFGSGTTAGNLLLAVVEGADTSTGHFTGFTESSGTWTQALTADNGNGAVRVELWALKALGSDAAPGFSMSATGGGTKSCRVAAMYELDGADVSSIATGSFIDTSGTYASGTTAGTLSSVSAATAASVGAAGEYAVSGFAQECAAATVT